MIPRSVYPKKAWPLASVRQHPCRSFLVDEANDPETKPNRLREVRAVLAIMDHVARDPAAYIEQPLARAFDSIRDLPPSYDKGALIAELERLKLFAVEYRGLDALLVPAEAAIREREPEPFKRAPRPSYDTVAARAPSALVGKARAIADARGVSLSAVMVIALAEFVAAAAVAELSNTD